MLRLGYVFEAEHYYIVMGKQELTRVKNLNKKYCTSVAAYSLYGLSIPVPKVFHSRRLTRYLYMNRNSQRVAGFIDKRLQ